jgi:hypothetical protein
MAINFYCPLGHRLVVPDDRAGKKGRCPLCHQKVIAPVPNPQPSGRAKSPSPLQPGHEFDELDAIIADELGLRGAKADPAAWQDPLR